MTAMFVLQQTYPSQDFSWEGTLDESPNKSAEKIISRKLLENSSDNFWRGPYQNLWSYLLEQIHAEIFGETLRGIPKKVLKDEAFSEPRRKHFWCVFGVNSI